MKYPRNVFEIHALVALEEILLHIEGLENETDVLFGVTLGSPERVVPGRDLRSHRVNDAQILHAARRFDRRQQLIEQLLVAFSVDENDWGAARNILFGDILKQVGFARARRAFEHDRAMDLAS